MNSENMGTLEVGDEKCKPLTRNKKTGNAKLFLVLPNNALSPLGYLTGDHVGIEPGDIWQGDLAAVKLTDGDWRIGFVFLFNAGVLIQASTTEYLPRWFHIDEIVAHGRVVSHEGRRVIQAGRVVASEGIAAIRFRFHL